MRFLSCLFGTCEKSKTNVKGNKSNTKKSNTKTKTNTKTKSKSKKQKGG